MKHFFYFDGEKQNGPYTFEQLKNENIIKETLIWFEGLGDWKPAKDIRELDEILELKPPPIPQSEFDTMEVSNNSKVINGKSYETNDKSESFVRRKQGMFSNLFSFQGRIRRIEYGVSFIISVMLLAILKALLQEEELAILGFAYIPLYWFLFAQGAKRCHDMGQSGWWQIIPFYPIWMIFGKGKDEIQNKYGANS